MMGRRASGIIAALLGAALVGSCNTIAVPIRPDGYGYTVVASDVVAKTDTIDGVIYTAGDTVTDTVDFKWPPSSLPVRIWVEDTLGLPRHFAAAIGLWKRSLIYGEFDAELVGDSSHADIIVRDALPPPPAAPQGVRRFAAMTLECEGATDIKVSAPDHRRLYTPTRIYIVPKYVATDPATVACLGRVAAHELGHALGLFQHSPSATDLMNAQPSVDAPSEVDAATVEWLYHQPTKLRPVPATDSLTAAPQAAP